MGTILCHKIDYVGKPLVGGCRPAIRWIRFISAVLITPYGGGAQGGRVDGGILPNYFGGILFNYYLQLGMEGIKCPHKG
jgi:hypothetical protein